MIDKSQFATAQEVADELSISKSKAYKMIHVWNEKLKEMGFMVIPGRVVRQFYEEQFYGMGKKEEK